MAVLALFNGIKCIGVFFLIARASVNLINLEWKFLGAYHFWTTGLKILYFIRINGPFFQAGRA